MYTRVVFLLSEGKKERKKERERERERKRERKKNLDLFV